MPILDKWSEVESIDGIPPKEWDVIRAAIHLVLGDLHYADAKREEIE